MLAIKTAISVEKQVYEEAENLAKEMHVGRSKLYTIAMKDFIERRKNKDLLEEINAAYSNEPTADEKTLLRVSRLQHKRILEREW